MADTDIITQQDLVKAPIERNSIQALWTRHKDALHPYITEMYQNYYMWTQTRKEQLVKDKETWRTNLRSPLTHMFTTGIYNMLLDSDIRFVCVDRKWTNQEMVKNILDMADNFSQQDDFMDPIWSAVFDQCLLGRWVYKTTYIYKKNKVEYLDKDGKKQTMEVIDDYWASRYVSLYNFFTMASSWYNNNRMVFERKLIPSTMIEKEYSVYWFKLKTQEVKEKWMYLDSVDYEAIKTNMAYYNSTEWRNIFDDDTYNIKDKMLEVIECHTDQTISIWVNWIVHWTYKQLWPQKKIRYHVLPFKKHAGMFLWIGVWYIVKPIQNAYDEIINMRLDNVKLALNKMFFMDSASTLFGNNPTMKVRPWLIYKVRSVDMIKEMQVSDVKQSSYTEIDAMFQMTQGLTWVSAPVLWMQAKVERTATGAELIKWAADSQMKQPLKAISKEMAATLKELVILAKVYMDVETIKKICWEDEVFSSFDLESLIRDFDFNYEMTSNSSENMVIKREQLLSLLDKQDKTLDVNGIQTMDIRKIVSETLKTFNLDFDWELTVQEYEKMVTDFVEVKKRLDAMNPQWGEPWADQWWWAPAPEWEASGWLAGLAWQPWAGLVPTGMMPNATGNNTPIAEGTPKWPSIRDLLTK